MCCWRLNQSLVQSLQRMGNAYNVLHATMPLKFLPCKEARFVSCLGVVDPASAPDNGPVESQDTGSLEELVGVSQHDRSEPDS